MLDQRRIADLGRDCDRLRLRVATAGRRDISRQIPVVVVDNLLRHPLQGPAKRNGDDADGAVILVSIVVADAVVAFVRKTRADALVIGNDERVIVLVQHHRAWRIGYRDHAEDRIRHALGEGDHRDRVGVIQRDVSKAIHGVDGNRVRRSAVGRTLAGHSDRQRKVDSPRYHVGSCVDYRDGVAISVGNQQVLSVERHPGRVQPRRDVRRDRHRGQVNHRNGTGNRGANHRVGDDFSAGGPDLEVRLRSGPATLVADVGGRALAVDQDAVRRVADADLRTLLVRAQVDLGERIVLVQQGVRALPIR